MIVSAAHRSTDEPGASAHRPRGTRLDPSEYPTTDEWIAMGPRARNLFHLSLFENDDTQSVQSPHGSVIFSTTKVMTPGYEDGRTFTAALVAAAVAEHDKVRRTAS